MLEVNEQDIILEETADNDDDFFNFEAEETTEAVEVESAEDSSTDSEADTTIEAPVTEESKPFLTLKYNHSELPIGSEEEARTLAQLGYHYQNKIAPEYEGLKQSAEQLSEVQRIADLYGMDVKSLANSLYEQFLEQQAAAQEVPVEVIRREQELAAKEAKIEQATKQQQSEAQRQDMFKKFWDTFPNADAKDIKPETWKMVESGQDLVSAYTIQRMNDLEAKNKALEQQIQNKQKAPVKSVTSLGSQEPKMEDDDFFRGFNS